MIGQACEFDYSGTQACRVLTEEGYRVVLANSNPATIMTDPGTADRTYVEPLEPEVLAAIIEKERPDALLPTLGGQTALNLTMRLVELGVLERYGVEVIGARPEAIATAEDRDQFKAAMESIGLEVPRSGFAHSLREAEEIAEEIGYPIMVRPSFILGGKGTGIAPDAATFSRLAAEGLAASPVGQILVERSIAGWKEFELEVMRDGADNCVVVCSIENFDPMGVHTGDSITVAPAQTLTDVEYQAMRDDAFACLRRVGVETGGSNVQFAVDPATGRRVIIEMNPRVSRSSALASKATGFPIAKIAARLAVGYLLNEIPNDITRATPASFEPTIDYVVTKVPRWAFEKLPGADARLGTRMQSVGEVMAIGRTFCESLQKALRSLEQGRTGLNADPAEVALDALSDEELLERVGVATPDRVFELEAALRRGATVDELAARTGIDPWFLAQLARISAERLRLTGRPELEASDFRRAKRLGFSDAQLAYLRGGSADEVRAERLRLGVRATFKTVDTCAAEFEAFTPYHYATYEEEDEIRSSDRDRVIILGSGPNRIGQGIEFDYCCVHASMTLRDAGYETVMVNCNPETVSTDYDTSDRLYFEPLTDEDVANVLDAELAAGGRVAGVIVSLGGQTPLKLAGSLPPELVLGTSPASIDLAEDRERWNALCTELGIPQPAGGTATTTAEALAVAGRVGYPVLLRPSYVLGGRAMEIVYDDDGVRRVMQAMTTGALAREGGVSAERPVLVDRFLEDAVEVDVDAVRDGTGEILIGGVMEHVEEAGVHSGDSACALPPQSLSVAVLETLERHTRSLADALGVCGLINVQYAVKDGQVYVLEANPRASRTVPFVAKATGVPLAMVASRVMVGQTMVQLRAEGLLPAGGSGPGARARPRERQGSRAALRPLPGRRHAPRPGDAVHRRGHGCGHHLRPGLRQEPDGGRDTPARRRHGVPVARRPGQAGRPGGGARLQRARLFHCGDAGDGGLPPLRGRRRGHAGGQGGGGGRRLRRRRADRAGQGAAGREHPAGPGPAGRRPAHPYGLGGVQGAVPHHPGRGAGRRRRHGRRALTSAPGAPAAGPASGAGREAAMSAAARRGAGLATRVGAVELANPVMTASGTSGHGSELAEYGALADLGAVVVKSLAAEPWPGNPAPRVHEVGGGMLNSVGLQGPGLRAWSSADLPALAASGARVVVSIWGRTVDDYARAAELAAAAAASADGACIVAVEVNVSCPNVEDRSRMFAHSAEATARVMAATECGLPRWAKLSPNVPDLVEIAAGALEAGAHGLTLVNTLLGLALDTETGRPLLGAGGGGLSGPAVHPVAVRAVWECRAAFPDVAIVGVGGVASGVDAIELLQAGADAVQVGTATFRDPRAPWKVLRQLARWCAAHGTTVEELRAGARRRGEARGRTDAETDEETEARSATPGRRA